MWRREEEHSHCYFRCIIFKVVRLAPALYCFIHIIYVSFICRIFSVCAECQMYNETKFILFIIYILYNVTFLFVLNLKRSAAKFTQRWYIYYSRRVNIQPLKLRFSTFYSRSRFTTWNFNLLMRTYTLHSGNQIIFSIFLKIIPLLYLFSY